MSPTGLTKFLDGTKPYRQTVARLREWYFYEAGVHQAPRELLAAQLRQFVVTLPKPDGGVAKLLEAGDASYREGGMYTPASVKSVRALVG